MKRLSVVIPTFNVEPIIARCLDALTWADEVVVVDMFSTDRTREICERYPNVKFIQRQDYIYGNVNFGFDNARGDWVMRLDSDEVVTPELAQEIQRKVLSREGDENEGYMVPSRLYFFGRWIRYAVCNRPKHLRTGYSYRMILFKKGATRYRVTHEHEDINVSGKRGWLTHPYDHYTCPSITHWINKLNYYTSRDAERVDLTRVQLNGRTVLKVALSPLVGFFRLYVQRQGYQDGMGGLIVCLLHANYYLVEQLKVWERKLKCKV